MSINRIAVIFHEPGEASQDPILGLSPLARGILGFKKAGIPGFHVVAGGDEAEAFAAIHDSAKDVVTVSHRGQDDTDLDVLRRISASVPDHDLVVWRSDVVIGPSDSKAIACQPLKPGGGASVAEGLVHVFSPAAIGSLEGPLDTAGMASALDARCLLARLPPVLLLMRHTGPDTCCQIENLLLQGLRKPVDIDGVVCYHFQRPITRRISRVLAGLPVKPNHVTSLAILLGVASGFVVAMGGYQWTLLGAALFYAGAFLDCIDGELARLKFQFSKRGEWLDTLADDLSTLSFLAGMTVALTREYGGVVIPALGGSVLAAFVVSSAYIYHKLVTVYRTGDLTAFKWSCLNAGGNGKPGVWDILKFVVKRDFFTTLFFLLAVINLIEVAFAVSCLALSVYFAVFVVEVIAKRGRGVQLI